MSRRRRTPGPPSGHSLGHSLAPALALAASLPCMLMTMATAGCRSAPQAKAPADARLSLELVLDAPAARPLLFVDERLVPLAPRPAAQAPPPITLRVTHGAHRIEARAEGHFPAYADVSIPADRSLRLRLRLDPDADTAREGAARDDTARDDAVRERLVP